MSNQLRLSCAVASVAGLACTAWAQCDWLVQHVPDFDQRRQNTPTVTGLPGDGAMYCVPTSRLDWCAYIANHGYPAVMSGPRKWSNNANYDFVTARDLFMGSLMGTDAATGSNVTGGLNGARAYLDLFAPGKFDVTHFAATGGWGPTLTDMTNSHTLGGLVCAGYGRYTESPAGFFTRTGGHAMTLVGIKDLCSGSPKLQFRDPASDPDNTTQSAFVTSDPLPVQPTPGLFRNGDTELYVPSSIYRYTSLTNHLCFLDGYSVIWPKHGLTTGSSTGQPETIQVLRPVQLDGNLMPPVQSFPTPTGGTVRDLAMSGRLTQYFYITGPVGSTPTEIFRLDPTTGVSTLITGFTNPTRVVPGRRGQIYILDSGTIFYYDVDHPPTTGAPPSTDSRAIDSMVYDDFTDQLVGLDAALRTVYLWSYTFAGGFLSVALPPDPCLNGRISLAISPADASLWLCSHNCDAIYKITGNPQTGLTVADTINLPGGSGPTGLNIGANGHVFFSSNGFLHEMEQDAANNWIDSPGSSFAGLPGGTTFFLSRSRSNNDSTMAGRGYYNLADPEIIHGTPDCYANCDGSTAAPILNVNDFICFLNEFASGDPEANCDDSTTPPVLNVNDFQCFLNTFAAGCP